MQPTFSASIYIGHPKTKRYLSFWFQCTAIEDYPNTCTETTRKSKKPLYIIRRCAGRDKLLARARVFGAKWRGDGVEHTAVGAKTQRAKQWQPTRAWRIHICERTRAECILNINKHDARAFFIIIRMYWYWRYVCALWEREREGMNVTSGYVCIWINKLFFIITAGYYYACKAYVFMIAYIIYGAYIRSVGEIFTGPWCILEFSYVVLIFLPYFYDADDECGWRVIDEVSHFCTY